MEDDAKSNGIIYWFLGAIGLGAVATAVTVPKFGLWLALVIILLALLIFGLYFLYRRLKSRRQSRNFEGAIEAQTSSSPRAISDPNRRAALDKLRQKFQSGLQEYKSRGKDIYKLPWYVIIGEPGSGKSEAIRHSGIDFPPGLQDELQGSGGTVNMDWWFTNRSIILDTAGSMIFNESQAGEAPEWREFLRLLKKARPYCPVNGLFLVLSVESLIKDSADRIAQKASRLAQQLDLIQRTLDVRFPVYLLVTKCDLLTGFREFFDNIEDPLLQHQMFGWSNPEPLDSTFRPEQVEQHLKVVAERVRRRRLALLREAGTAERYGDTQFFTSKSQPGAATKRRLDEIDSLFALPESVMRLAPRLRRYLETIFVAGEWSAKPVFLRGIYFTSSMREGRALDEAMALAAGVALEQLPDDRTWEKNRSFFMRDLFLEKVFREYGLVTRATNTLQLIRKRKLLIFGAASVAMLLLVGISYISYRSLKRSVLAELSYWNVGSSSWNAGEWAPPVMRSSGSEDLYHFVYTGGETVPATEGLSVIEFHQRLQQITEKPLAVGWVFKPMSWFTSAKDMHRQEAQRLLFECGVLKPLVFRTREKMESTNLPTPDKSLVDFHREALLSLIRLEADNLQGGGGSLAGPDAFLVASRYLTSFQSYLADTNQPADTNLVNILLKTYAGTSGSASWPPKSLLSGSSLADNPAVKNGLTTFRQANQSAQQEIQKDVEILNTLADSLYKYQQDEAGWQSGQGDLCSALTENGALNSSKNLVDTNWAQLSFTTNLITSTNSNLTSRYVFLEKAARDASADIFKNIYDGIPEASKTSGLFADISTEINGFAKAAAAGVHQSYDSRSAWLAGVDRDQVASVNGIAAYAARWNLYVSACALAQATVSVDSSLIGDEWKKFVSLKNNADAFRSQLSAYDGPLVGPTTNLCQQIAGAADHKVKEQFVDEYSQTAVQQVQWLFDLKHWSADEAPASRDWLDRLGRDLRAANENLFNPQDLAVLRASLRPVSQSLLDNSSRLRNRIGFPVLLNASPDQVMSFDDLSALRNLLDPLIAALSDPAWTGLLDANSQTQAQSEVQKLKEDAAVISALINPDGKLASVEVFFLPPTSSPDTDIINDFRQSDVILGDTDSGWQEVADKIDDGRYVAGFSFGKGTVDGSLKIAFRQLPSTPAQTVLEGGSWSLLRFISSGRIQRVSDNEWDLKINLKDPDAPTAGTVVFKLVTERPLPKLEEWPQ